MSETWIRVYAELNDHLPVERRFVESRLVFEGTPTIRNLLETNGIPPAEVDLVLLNGVSVSFEAAVRQGDRLSAYPVFESFDISADQRVRDEPLRLPGFVLDVHLGKLASHLRMAGFDAVYQNDYGDPELVEIACRDQRVLLSRDRQLIDKAQLDRAFRVRAENPEDQLAEVLERFQLQRRLRPFTRCLRCNELLITISINEIRDKIPERVRESQTIFRRCPVCQRIYWPGTHVERMSALMERVLGREAASLGGSAPNVDFD
jgi:hypothetical protein